MALNNQNELNNDDDNDEYFFNLISLCGAILKWSSV